MDSSASLLDETNTKKRKSVEDESLKLEKELYCEICKITCNSKETLDSHKTGLKHKVKEAQNYLQKTSTEKEYKADLDDNNDEMEGLWCRICNVKCTGKATMQSHLNGKKHKAKKLKTGACDGGPKAEILKEDVDLQKKGDDANAGKITDGSRCLVCKAKFRDQATLIMHLNGNYHKSEEERLRWKKKIEMDEQKAEEDWKCLQINLV